MRVRRRPWRAVGAADAGGPLGVVGRGLGPFGDRRIKGLEVLLFEVVSSF